MLKSKNGGYALTLAIFMMVVVLGVVSGSFLAVQKQKRETSREFLRIRLEWAARGLYDSAVYEFQQKLKELERAPAGNELSNLKTAAEGLFSDIWPQFNSTLTIQFDRNVNSSSYFYIKAEAKDPQTQLSAYKEGYVFVGTGNIMDFSLFYDGDLEIAPGETAEIQGPIFANGDVYLMSGVNQSLTIKEPDSAALAGSDYVLHSAGNIFFNFKPMIGRNYFLENSPSYKNGAASYYDDDLNHHGVEVAWSLLQDIPGKGIVAFPKFYYPKNNILDVTWSTTPATHDIFFQNKNGDSHSAEFPSFNFFAGNTWEYMNDPSYVEAIYDAAQYPDAPLMSVSPAFDLANHRFYDNLTYGARLGFKEGEDAVKVPSVPNPGWEQLKQQINSDLYQGEPKVADQLPRHIVPLGNLPEGSTNHALIDAGSINENSARLASKADLIVRCGTADCSWSYVYFRTSPGQIPEPLISPYFRDKKIILFSPFRNLRLARLVGTSTDNLNNESSRYNYGYHQSAVVDAGALTYALNECAKARNNEPSEIDSSDALCSINDSDGVIVYVETAPYSVRPPGTAGEGGVAPGSIQDGEVAIQEGSAMLLTGANPTLNWPLRQVVVKNGSRLPAKGMTIATNGWMWLRGSYNIYQDDGVTPCAAPSNNQLPECDTPPAALFSDAFGIVSSEGNEINSFENGYSIVNQAPNDVVVNATVVTGHMPSQLERRYPDCGDINSPADIMKCGGGSTPGTDYIGAPCPAGLKNNGEPNDPENCSYYFNPQNAAYYFRRNAILRDWLVIIKSEIEEYEAVRAHFQYVKSDGTILNALRLPDHPDWFTGSAAALSIPQQLTELQNDIDRMTAHMNTYVDINPNNPVTYQLLDDLRAKYGRFNYQLPAFEGYFVRPPDVGAARGALYGQIGQDSTGVFKDLNAGVINVFAYEANKSLPPALNFFGHPVYKPGVPGTNDAMGGYYFTPGYNSRWMDFDPAFSSISDQDLKKQQKFEYQVKILWCGSSGAPAEFDGILAGCSDVEKRNQIYWRMFSYDFNAFPHHWSGIPFYPHTSNLSLGQAAGNVSADAVAGFQQEPVQMSPLENNLQPIASPSMAGSGFRSIRIEKFYQANMIGVSSGSGQWIAHPGDETHLPWTEYVPDPSSVARFMNLRDIGRGGGVDGFLRPYFYNPAKPDDYWNKIYFAHGRQYPMYKVRYSGGWENLINFQERWSWNTSCQNTNNGKVCQQQRRKFFFRGSQAAPWEAQEMRRKMDDDGRTVDTSDPTKAPKAFYKTDYYSAPERYYDYDERLSMGLEHRPPGMVSLVSVQRTRRLPEQEAA